MICLPYCLNYLLIDPQAQKKGRSKLIPIVYASDNREE